MNGTEKHPTKNWEVSLVALHTNGDIIYKVSRRLAEMSVAETKIFPSKEEAQKQFDDWLS